MLPATTLQSGRANLQMTLDAPCEMFARPPSAPPLPHPPPHPTSPHQVTVNLVRSEQPYSEAEKPKQ